MKRLKRSTPREGKDSSKAGFDIQHDHEQLYCLERLCRELEHANESRRDGACAAINWLGRLVNLRAAAGRISCEEALRQVFDASRSPDDVDGFALHHRDERSIVEREHAEDDDDETGDPTKLLKLLN